MLEATEYPAEIADFYSAISAGYYGVFLVAKIVARYLTKKVSSPIPSATTWIDLCWILCNSARVVATFKEDSFDGRSHLNFFYSTFTLYFLF